MLKILTVPAETEILRRKSEPVGKIDAELAAFLKELGETLKGQKDPAGVGLSAIQVGRAIRAFAMFLPIEKDTEPRGPTPQGRTLGGRTLEAKPELTFYINPEMAEHAAEMTLGQDLVQSSKFKVQSSNQRINASTHQPFLEGCLSIPRIYGAVLRWPWVRAKAFVLTEQTLSSNSDFRFPRPRLGLAEGGQISDFQLDDLASRVFQHELDHLNGILFTDHVLAQGNKLFREEGKEMVAMEM